jgi:acetyl-CoA carboxylase biotin carboxylase subunit
VQVLGDRRGNIVHLFERDCSLQRRHQKIVEETPCPVLDDATRAALCAVAVKGASSLGYHSAGTFEFLLDQERGFYFLEMNTRLQVEHPITELVTGVDLVREMLLVAAGEPLALEPATRGVAIEARICAEDPARGFVPCPGKIEELVAAAGPYVRDDSGVFRGASVSPHYDPLLAKLAVWAPTRAQALARLARALGEYQVVGIETNLAFLERLIATPEVLAGVYDTGFVERRARELGAAVPEDDDAAVVAAAAVFASLGERSAVPAEAEASLSPWVLAERQARLGR